jgi:hypothetical protein
VGDRGSHRRHARGHYEGLRLQALVGLLPLEEDFADSEYPQIEIKALRSIVVFLEPLIGTA